MLVIFALALGAWTDLVGKPSHDPAAGPGVDGSSGPNGTSTDGTGTTENGGIDFSPAPSVMRRLTQVQWKNSLSDILNGVPDLSLDLEADNTVERFSSIGASKIATSDYGVEQYIDAALVIATQVIAQRSELPILSNCSPDQEIDPCVRDALYHRGVLSHYGRKLWRRSLTDEELTRYSAVVEAAGDTAEDLELGLTYALAGLMSSPYFLYIGAAGEAASGQAHRQYTGVEMASRLSYLLWNSTPDDILIDAAESGALNNSEGIAEQTRRMLTNPRAEDLAYRFFAENWNIDRLEVSDKNLTFFPSWSEELMEDAKQEFRMVVLDFVAKNTDLRDLFSTNSTFINDRLANFYDLPPAGATNFTPTTLPATRMGVLTSAAVIAANSPSDRTSPTERGAFLLDRVLCTPPPPPPAGAVTDTIMQDPSGEGESVRKQLERHRADPTCAGCHATIDPAGLALENFNGIGAYVEEIAIEGENFDPLEIEGQVVTDAIDVMEWIRQDQRTADCIAESWYQYSVGHASQPTEIPAKNKIRQAFEASGYQFTELVVALTESDGFRFMAPLE